MSGSTIPATLTALTALFRGAAPAGVRVIDGPAYDPPPKFLAVGWDRSDQPAVVAVNTRDDAAAARGRETCDVSCLLSFEVGNAALSAVRASTFAAFDAFAAALRADITLGRTVLSTWISTYEMTPIVTTAGDVIDLRFTVQYTAVK